MINYHVSVLVICQIYITRISQKLWFFTHFVNEKSQLLTDPHDANVTDNQRSIHTNFYQDTCIWAMFLPFVLIFIHFIFLDYPLLEELPALKVVPLFSNSTGSEQYTGFELQCSFKPINRTGKKSHTSIKWANVIHHLEF